MPKVSIIVPVYNAEKYISRCIDSILTQEFTDFELILVNDGSKDNSGSICDGYAKNDPRVQVIHKENTGVSNSRNLALDKASGTYIQFLDSDDWITPDATKLFVRSAEENNCDLVISDFYRVVGERLSQKGDIEIDTVMTQEEFASCMMENPADFYYGVLWNKLYRRDIIESHHLRMDETISWCEDFMFNLEYIRYADSFFALHIPVYYYVKTKGSLASQGTSITKTIRMKLMVFEYYNNFYKHVFDESDYEKNRLQVYRFFLDAAGDGVVPPTILPGSRKLGEERSVISREAVAGDGILTEFYRGRKLLERYIETAALKNELSLDEAALLLHLTTASSIQSRKTLADYTGMTQRKLSVTLQKLVLKGFIKLTDIRDSNSSGRLLDIKILPAAEKIIEDLNFAQNEYEQTRFSGFTEDELIQYARLSEKIKRNIQNTLI